MKVGSGTLSLNTRYDPLTLSVPLLMQATWLKEAINDLDSSCEKITIIAGPPLPEEERLREERRDQDRPNGKNGERKARERAGIFRLKAKGDFGMTEVSICMVIERGVPMLIMTDG